MKAYLGIDGGGSKTLFALADEEGRLLSVWRAGSASYKQIGTEGLLELVKTGRKQVLLLAKEKLGEEIFLESCCLGMPMYGESEEMDRKIEEQFKQHFPQDKLLLVNDAVAGWAGALLLQPGINVVAGTGSIAYGRNEQGQEGRSGGWSEWFSDEGSGRWLGMRCLQLFSKEADGRLEKGALYDLVKKQLKLKQDEEIIDLFEREYLPRRDRLASLQRILLEAARAGDREAKGAYEEAAGELAELARAVKQKLFVKEGCPVTCSGGIFQVGDLVMKPFQRKLEEAGMEFVKRQAEPHLGAILLAYAYSRKQKPPQSFEENLRKPV